MKVRRKVPYIINAYQIIDEWFDGPHPNPLFPCGVWVYPKDYPDPELRRTVSVNSFAGIEYGRVDDWVLVNEDEMWIMTDELFKSVYEIVEE